MKRIILIGASGFLGRHLLEEIHLKGNIVFAVQHKSKVNIVDGNKIIKGGISSINAKVIDELNPDVVIHCARPSIPFLKKLGRKIAAEHAHHLNKRLLRELKKSQRKPKVLFVSGSLMYGNSKEPHDENANLQPISYARQYYKGELPVLLALKENYPVQILRFPWLLGAGSWFRWFYLNSMIKCAAIPSFGDMNNMMQILNIRDAASQLHTFVTNINDSGIYNICSDSIVSQREFLTNVSSAFGFPILNYNDIFSKRLEEEAVEAFTSNVVMKTNFPDIFGQFIFTPLSTSLQALHKDFKLSEERIKYTPLSTT